MVGPIGRLVQLAGSGIGLAAEAIEANKTRSRSSPNIQTSGHGSSSAGQERVVEAPPEYVERLTAQGQAVPFDASHSKQPSHHEEESDEDSDSSLDEDEKAWELDEAAERIDPQSYEEDEQKSPPDYVQQVLRLVEPAPPVRPHLPLPYPVIIPQRRPQNKSRGFVRAYAPVLYECGIDQATFLQFLKSFHQASKASPILEVIFVSAAIAGFTPSVYAMIASTVVQVVVGTAKELQSRKRANNFLDEMNDKLFAPRGLYAFIMTYKPDDERPISTHQVGLAEQFVKYQEAAPSKLKENLKGIRLGDGRTYGEIEMPEAAPLIYPSLQEAAISPGTKDKLKSGQKFVADYFDRRAQAKYSVEHPNSTLAVPERPQFASRYSDPNHPANSGSLISLITGGAVNPKARKEGRREAKRERDEAKREREEEAKRERKGAKRERSNERRIARGKEPKGPREPKSPREPKGRRKNKKKKGGIVTKVLQQDVLYLMVVNMPTDEEVAAARQEMAWIQAEKEQAKGK